MSDPIKELIAGVLANLIPTLIVALVVYTLLKRIIEYHQDDFLAQRVSELESRVIAELERSRVQIDSSLNRAALRSDLFGSDRHDADNAGARGMAFGPLSRGQRREQAESIGHLLHGLSLALTGGLSEHGASIRMFCHLIEKDSQLLKPLCRWSQHHTEDYDAEIPVTGPESRPFVVARAYQERRVVAEDLPVDHVDLYPTLLRGKILPELKCVVAAPICDFEPTSNEVIGTISIDCSTSDLRALGFDQKLFKESMVWCSKSVYRMLQQRKHGESAP